MRQWMVRVWFNAHSDEDFIDEMATMEYLFETEAEALAFKKAFNDKYRNHGGWEFHYHKYGMTPVFSPGSPAEGPYEQSLPETFSVEEAIAESFGVAECWGMEEEE